MNELLEPEIEEPRVRQRLPEWTPSVQPEPSPSKPPELYLFGAIIQHPEHPRVRYCWLGARMTVAGATAGATLAMRAFGVDSRNADVTDLWQFGRVETPGQYASNNRPSNMFDAKLVAHWVQANAVRGIPLINPLDSSGRPVFTWPPGTHLPRDRPVAD